LKLTGLTLRYSIFKVQRIISDADFYSLSRIFYLVNYFLFFF